MRPEGPAASPGQPARNGLALRAVDPPGSPSGRDEHPPGSLTGRIWESRLWHTARGRGRLGRTYLPVGIATSVVTVWLAMWAGAGSLAYRLSLATAFTGLILFGLSLALGPVSLLWRGRPLPVSTNLRRDLGILAAVVSLIHVVSGLLVFNDVRSYFVYPPADWTRTGTPIRLDDLGAANWMGLVATVLLVVLLLTSGDWALHRYGARRWKAVQRLAYWTFALVVVHGMLYQRYDPRDDHPLVIAFAVIVCSVLALQVAGYLKASRPPVPRRTSRRASPGRATPPGQLQ